MNRRIILILFAFLAPLCGCASSPSQRPINVLVFSRTQGFRHESIPVGVEVMRQLCAEAGYTCVATENASVFTSDNLEQFRVVVFLNTTGDVLSDEQQRAFEDWFTESAHVRERGFVGIHSAADTEYDWPFYHDLVGSYFASHPHIQQADVVRTDAMHPATAMLPEHWTRTDEWYNYRTHPMDRAFTVLLTLDTDSYLGSTMPGDHPIAWCRDSTRSRGRTFYTGGGHTIESFGEPLFRQHLLAAMRWAAHDEND